MGLGSAEVDCSVDNVVSCSCSVGMRRMQFSILACCCQVAVAWNMRSSGVVVGGSLVCVCSIVC